MQTGSKLPSLLSDLVEKYFGLETGLGSTTCVSVIEVSRMKINADGRFTNRLETAQVHTFGIFPRIGQVNVQGWILEMDEMVLKIQTRNSLNFVPNG